MLRRSNSPSLVFFASTLLAFLLFILLVSGPSSAGVSMSARPGAPAAISSVIWGSDINVGGGGQQATQPFISTRRKDHVMDVDPTNPNHVTAAFVQIAVGFESHYANSSDGGRTWTRGTLTNFGSYYSGGNASFGYDGHGVGYYTTLAISDTLTALFAYTSTTGTSWNGPAPIVVYPNSEYRFMPTLAVDKRFSGPDSSSVYIFYELYGSSKPFNRGIWTKYSRDGAQTWSGEVHVSDANRSYAYGPTSAVASDGTVYTAFEYRPTNRVIEASQLYLDRSTDGGVTWGTDRLVTGAEIVKMGAPDWKELELTLPVVQNDNCIMLRINHYPSIAVSPINSNAVYVVWNDGRWEPTYQGCAPGSGRHSDIAFSGTTDGGLTWSAPMRINDDTQGNRVDQFMPTVRVSPSGTVGITFYDRRYDPNHVWYDLSYTESTDGGVTWSANQRVTDVSSDPDVLGDTKGIDDIGIRKALVYGPDYAIPSWLDTRLGSGQGEFFIDRGIITTTTATPTWTPTHTPTRTATSPPPTGTAISSAISTATTTRTPVSTIPATATAASTATATSTPGFCALQFEDVPSTHTFYTFVRCLACRGILSGYPCGGPGEPCGPNSYPYFRPGANITRGQLSKVVSNAAGFSEPASGQSFQDVPPGSTFYDFVERLVSRGVMNGYPCGGPGEPCMAPGNLPYFRPNNNATRGQISKIVAIAAGITDPPGAQIFEDVTLGSTFYTFVQQLTNLGVMNGYPCGNPEPCGAPGNLPYFRPNSNATRGQVSKIVSNTFFPGCNP